MPQANEWKPEDGDSVADWWPDPERPIESYTDEELRFLPVYRQARSAVPYDPTDAETLTLCREMIEGYLEPDSEPEVEQEKPLLRLLSSQSQ
jgi:hypothetical protein